ncbi:MAG: NAD/NADP octopine/nopaline dehydrogenase family protein [Aigarchaeota archaeon]|nr:NAD/NADP octopine/nopaline dehydrogenase family protein [Aigarchaeota archaeon]
MKVAILGGGNGARASAAYLTVKGFDVKLYSAFKNELKDIQEKGGIEYSGAIGEGFAEFPVASTLADTLEEVDIINIVTPATAHEYFAKACSSYLTTDRLVFLNPGSTGGSLNFARALREHGLKDLPLICETNTLTYVTRIKNPIHIEIFSVSKYLLFAAFPGRRVNEAYDLVRQLYPSIKLAENVLETGLHNMNSILHPPGMLMNAGWIEYSKGQFYYYYEGTTPAVGRMIETLDAEREAVARKLGVKTQSFLEVFHASGLTIDSSSVYNAMQASEADRYIKAPSSLAYRFLSEDVPYGLVPVSSIGKEVDAPTPFIDIFIILASHVNQTDYWKTGLTAEKMGIKGMGVEKLKKYLQDG